MMGIKGEASVSGRRIGFLGTGIMGGHMARRLCEGGHSVTAWNRSREKAVPLETLGARIAGSPTEAAEGAEIVICMLSDGPVCDAVLIDDGTMAAMPAGSLVIVMSSIPVETARAQAEKAAELGLRYIDAPVSGGEPGARDGTLAIMAGGEEGDVEEAREIFEALGRPTRVGPAGSGELAKLANQVIVSNTLATVAEALLLAKVGGADPAAVREALLGGFADSTILRQHGKRMIEGDFKPGGPAKYQLKDQRTAMSLARDLELQLPVSALVEELFDAMVRQGRGDTDHSGIFIELHRLNSLSIDVD
jgi:2-hydroxy-3-oxopropionate reductase